MNSDPNPALRRILVIDDNPAIHQDFRKIFEVNPLGEKLEAAEAAFFGDVFPAKKGPLFLIDSAMQGQEGFARVKIAASEGRPYSMAFIDVRMPPGWDGIETAGRLWELDADLQIVICTAYSDYSWDEIIEKLGMSDRMVILKKPFDNIEVRQLAHALTEKRRLLQQVKGEIAGLAQVADRQAAELMESEERFRLIAENAGDLIAIVDASGKRHYQSPSYGKILGLTPELLADPSPALRVHPEDRERVLAIIQAALATGGGEVMEYRVQHCDGSWRVLESHSNPVLNAEGKVEHLVLVARDITERKKAEEERAQMEVQLRHAQKMESIGQLAAGIAHEINTPTQYIGDNTQFLQDGFRDLSVVLDAHHRLLETAREAGLTPELVAEVEAATATADVEYLSAEIPKAIEQSLEGVQRVTKIVGAMKEFSHPGTDQKVAVDLNRAIESTLTVARNEWRYVAEVKTDFDPKLPPVPCLPGEFNQVILNLIINATHAIADVVKGQSACKGIIGVSTRKEGEWAEIRISDSGTGIPEEIRPRIFDPFFTTKGVGKGTGQGLAIAHSVIFDKHGGQIAVESAVGEGTLFIIRLPLSGSACQEQAAA